MKAALVEALRITFDIDYPEADFRGIKIGIEYPVAKADYPGIWVNFDDTQELTIAGIAHTEFITVGNAQKIVTRWRFGGTLTMTVTALSSLERDRLFDELIKVIAFARVTEQRSDFRLRIEQNDLLAMNANFDLIRPSGDNAAPGTPWGTDEFIYERSLSIDLIGEFVSEPDTMVLVPLHQVRVLGYPIGTPEPAFTGESTQGLDPGDPGSTPHDFVIEEPRWV